MYMVWRKRVGERCAINDGAGMFLDYAAGYMVLHESKSRLIESIKMESIVSYTFYVA